MVALLMTAFWIWHRRLRNVGVVDVGWPVSVALLALFHAVAGPGYAARRWLIGTMFVGWGGRLALHLLQDRVLARPEDPRYAALRTRRSVAAVWSFFPFFQAQAFLAVVLSLPALVAAFNPAPRLATVEIVAVLAWGAAVWGEAVADQQLKAFKARHRPAGRTCREGLWHYSRHPNYFFEWVTWLAYALFALASPWGVVGLICPALMLYLLFRVTGIPETEAQALRSKGDDYRRYQETTNVFVPWKPWSRS